MVPAESVNGIRWSLSPNSCQLNNGADPLRLRRERWESRSRQPYFVAAMLGNAEEMSRYLLVNTESVNPYMRVMPASMIDGAHRGYHRRKYAKLVRRAAWNILRPFVRDEESIEGNRQRESRLDTNY
jgi:hypothetical protein